jgi:ketosteroid isomerase-like protein
MGTGKDLWNELETHYSKLDYTGLATLFASDGVHVDAFGRHEGREAIRAYLEEGDKPFSGLRMETRRLIEEADTVVAEWTWWALTPDP